MIMLMIMLMTMLMLMIMLMIVLMIMQEDFQPMTYGFKLACDVTDMRAMGMVKEVEDDLNRTIKVSLKHRQNY